MARLRSVCDIWPIIGIFLIWIDECKNISLESSSSPGSMVSLSYSSFRRSSVSMLSALALLSFCANVLTILSVGCPAVRGLFCYKHERLSIVFTLSLLLLFKCYLSPWWFKYLFSSGRRSFLSFVTSSPHITVLIWVIFCLFIVFLLNTSTSFIKALCHFNVLLKYFTFLPTFFLYFLGMAPLESHFSRMLPPTLPTSTPLPRKKWTVPKMDTSFHFIQFNYVEV